MLTVELVPETKSCYQARRMVVLQKNPSLADATRRDPTVGRVESWARRRRFSAITYVNLFALRSPNPAELNRTSYARAVGPENDRYLLKPLPWADVIVLAWGNPNGIDPERYRRRIQEVLTLLRDWPLYRVGPLTRLGHPRHGLRWEAEHPLILFRQET
jgi:hypothetical protein